MGTHEALGRGRWALSLVLSLCAVAPAPGATFQFSDGFEDGDISDWTTATMGTGVVEATTDRACGGVWSLHVESIEQGDLAYAIGPAGFDNLDFTKAYTVDLDFNYDKTNDQNGFHFLEVMAMNGAGGQAHHVGLYLDRPGMAGGQDELIYRDSVPSNHTVAGLKEDVWYHLAMDVDPASQTYDLTVSDTQQASQVYDWLNSQWVNSLTTDDIPFIGAGQGGNFFPFRVGDRNADAAGYDHGEAYWDNIVIQGTWVPEPTFAVLLMAGLGPLLRRRRKR